MAKKRMDLRARITKQMAGCTRTFKNPSSTRVVNRADRFKNEERQRIFESKETKPKMTAEEAEATYTSAIEKFKVSKETQKQKYPIVLEVDFDKSVKKPNRLTSVAKARTPSRNSNSRSSCVSNSGDGSSSSRQARKRPASKAVCIPFKKQRNHVPQLAKQGAGPSSSYQATALKPILPSPQILLIERTSQDPRKMTKKVVSNSPLDKRHLEVFVSSEELANLKSVYPPIVDKEQRGQYMAERLSLFRNCRFVLSHVMTYREVYNNLKEQLNEARGSEIKPLQDKMKNELLRLQDDPYYSYYTSALKRRDQKLNHIEAMIVQ